MPKIVIQGNTQAELAETIVVLGRAYQVLMNVQAAENLPQDSPVEEQEKTEEKDD